MSNTQQLPTVNRLPREQQLAARLDASRPSSHKALRSLQATRRLEIRHGIGAFVTAPTAQQALRATVSVETGQSGKLFDLREVLELPPLTISPRHGQPR